MSCQTPHVGGDRRVNRIKAVEQALDGRVKRIYLEIGVEYGRAFGRIARRLDVPHPERDTPFVMGETIGRHQSLG